MPIPIFSSVRSVRLLASEIFLFAQNYCVTIVLLQLQLKKKNLKGDSLLAAM
jgi:hypothetical protein